jgi:hypothetical protein
MDKSNKDKILEMIGAIEERNSEMEKYISNLSLLSRNEMLKEITLNIISNNNLLQELIGTDEKLITGGKCEKPSSDLIIEGYLSQIQKDPYKKVIYLRDFLDLFSEKISEKDKEVILQSLKDEIENEKLKERMISLVNIFKLNS